MKQWVQRMNNYVIQTRSAATAAATAFILVSHGVQEQVQATSDELSPLIRFNHASGSHPRIVPLTLRQVAERADVFDRAVTEAFQELARRQQSLEPALVRALAKGAWDLYEVA